MIIKMGSVANCLGSGILAHRPDSKALSLHAPLPVYLASIARKGLWGRVWARKLFETLRSAKLTELGFTEAEFFEHTDLQIGVDAWLILHRVMADAARAHGSRVRSLDSGRLMSRPEHAIGAVAGHFGLSVDAGVIVADPLFQRHAKTGEMFNAAQRAEELREATATRGEEIGMVIEWARIDSRGAEDRLGFAGTAAH